MGSLEESIQPVDRELVPVDITAGVPSDVERLIQIIVEEMAARHNTPETTRVALIRRTGEKGLTSAIQRFPDHRERQFLGIGVPLVGFDAMTASAASKVALALDHLGLKR